MTYKQRSEAIKQHHAQLDQLLHSVAKELEALSELGSGGAEWYEPDGTIIYLYRDVSLLKYSRQVHTQSCISSPSDDRSDQSECNTPSHILHQREWEMKIGSTRPGSFYKFGISRLNGVIEETSIREYETSVVPTDNEI